MKGTTLMAQPFDERRFLLTGEPAPVAEGIAAMDLYFDNPAAFSTSETDILAYRQGNIDTVKELAWFDRSGRRLETVGGRGDYRNLALSPDETRLVLSQMNPLGMTRDLWLFDLTRASPTRFTYDPGIEASLVVAGWNRDRVPGKSKRSCQYL